ncbi:hypothetical protein [Marinicrinis lubricantis]|uniref:NB-ARC domain-containing protein n=1 Tax=Marinicrinis lubricantis TaxID=2086470 RepID=A0ABW1INA8_9BACL
MKQVPKEKSFDHRRVIGLDKELERLEHWMTNPCPETLIFSISGIGGIGKTTLLMEMAAMSRQASLLTLWLDGQVDLPTSASFLSGIEMGLESEYGRKRDPATPLLLYIISELSRQRTILLIDNWRRIRKTGGVASLQLPPSASVYRDASHYGFPKRAASQMADESILEKSYTTISIKAVYA